MKNCPFCGSKRVRIVNVSIKYERDSYIRVKCDSCAAYGPIARNRFDAQEFWDKRIKADR